MRRGALLTITAALLLLPIPARPTPPAPSLEDRQLSAALQHLAAQAAVRGAFGEVSRAGEAGERGGHVPKTSSSGRI